MTDPAGAGIYANIKGGILMGFMLPYIAYMQHMGNDVGLYGILMDFLWI